MGWIHRLFRTTARKERLSREADRELAFHIDELTRENIAVGMRPDEARRRARITFGAERQIAEDCRTTRSIAWLDTLAQDVRYALRVLKKNPGFGLVAVLALTLGIGATTAVYSVVDSTILRSLPFPDPDRLYEIRISGNQQTIWSGPFPDEYAAWVEETESFDAVVAVVGEYMNLTGSGEPQILTGAAVPATFFKMVGAEPALGRTFAPEEDVPGAKPVVILDHSVWRQTFGEDAQVLGRSIILEGQPYTVIGVMQQGFRFPLDSVKFWTALSRDPEKVGSVSPLAVYARIKRGVSAEQAASELNVLASNLAAQFPERSGRIALLTPLHEAATGTAGKLPLVLLGAVLLVLLIAVANVANLMLCHASSRTKEIAVRLSLGARRVRIVRQLLTESLLLSSIGGTLGLACAALSIGSIAALVPDNIPRVDEITVDLRIALFTGFVSIATGVLFAVYPAWSVSQQNLSDSFKRGSQARLAGLRGRGVRTLLTVTEIALAMILCIGAGLLLKTFLAHMAVEIGVDPANAVAFHIPLDASQYARELESPEFRTSKWQSMLAAIGAVPGVEEVAISSDMPLKALVADYSTEFTIGDRPESANSRVRMSIVLVTAGYFRAMGLTLLRGRLFTEAENKSGARVLLVSEDTAELFWPGRDPLGKTLHGGPRRNPRIYTVIGVVEEVKKTEYQTMLANLWQGTVYWPLFDGPYPSQDGFFVVVRTHTDPRPLVTVIRQAIRSVDPSQAITSVELFDEVVEADLAPPRFRVFLLGSFAGIALLIAGIGVYGVVSYSVAGRTHEIGVRMALGARRSDIFRAVVEEGLILVLLGIFLGVIGALGLTRFIAGFLFATETIDGPIFFFVAAMFGLVAVVACWLPARRASKADPMSVLRCE